MENEAAHKQDQPDNEQPEGPRKRTSKPGRGILPELGRIKPVHMRFANAYVANGGNASQAYLAATNNKKPKHPGTPGVMGTKWLDRDNVRAAIHYHMSLYGADVETVSKRIGTMVQSTDPWVADRGITHSRAVLGLDAPAQSHIQVDKREVVINLSGKDAKALLDSLISKSKG